MTKVYKFGVDLEGVEDLSLEIEIHDDTATAPGKFGTPVVMYYALFAMTAGLCFAMAAAVRKPCSRDVDDSSQIEGGTVNGRRELKR